MDALRHQALTYQLRGAIFRAHNTLRTGWSEEVYHQGMLEVLAAEQVPVVSKPRRVIVHRGVEVHTFEADLITWDTIVLELKVLPFGDFTPAHQAQLIHYLKCWGKGLGLLVNFGALRARIERYVWDEPELRIQEDYRAITPHLSEAERQLLTEIRNAILDVARQYGLGYPDTLYRKVLAVEAAYRGLECQQSAVVPASWAGRTLLYQPSEHLLVGGTYLIGVRAMLKCLPIYDFARMKTFLNALHLQTGLLVNFGKQELQIFGISAK
jgi:GxxExxY protein